MSLISVEGRLDPAWPIEAQDLIREMAQAINRLATRDQDGAGTPENRIVGYRGHTWRRTDAASAATAIYVFGGTDGTRTGWVAL